MIPLMKCVVLTAVIHILVFWLNHKTVHMGEKNKSKGRQVVEIDSANITETDRGNQEELVRNTEMSEE